MENYYGLIYKAYKIITEKLNNTGLKALRLQMAIKTVNDTANPDSLILTLLVFKAYLKINIDLSFTLTQTQKA